MQMLSDDDRDLEELSDEALALAWDLWFDLAQTTNQDDPPYTHGVFQRAGDSAEHDDPTSGGPSA